MCVCASLRACVHSCPAFAHLFIWKPHWASSCSDSARGPAAVCWLSLVYLTSIILTERSRGAMTSYLPDSQLCKDIYAFYIIKISVVAERDCGIGDMVLCTKLANSQVLV